MRVVLYLQNNGIEKLPLENDFEEPLKSFMDIAVNLIIDGQSPEIASKPQSAGRLPRFLADRGFGEQGEEVLVMKFGSMFA